MVQKKASYVWIFIKYVICNALKLLYYKNSQTIHMKSSMNVLSKANIKLRKTRIRLDLDASVKNSKWVLI